ncbi:hypothetical protein CFR75_05270 [Komagataeibacter xylinus]|uniref:Uncharacterized protein n=1 Tax=Komagataeibacter xylinus TaxID=28448 RepID=A0A318PVL7_KOMXY|nr:hypothetical protein [Komagataeibacter xylinus]AZV39777.1 hypothetical protein CXP35_14370 [Komagataeibacter xylinus]PYD57664.1 hypothetical protein CFR75_05270 [Komagataeibacter xylinus]
MNIIEAYMDFLSLCEFDVYTLFYFWNDKRFDYWRISGTEYGKEWCQDALDLAYRMIKTGFMGIDYPNSDPTPEEMKKIFHDFAAFSPNVIDGAVIWSTYQFYLAEKGEAFVHDWKRSGDNAVFERKLVEMFDAHGIGFDKQGFVPVTF